MKSVAPVTPATPVVIPITSQFVAPLIAVANEAIVVDQDVKNESMDADSVVNEGEGPRWKKNFVNYKKKGGIRKFFVVFEMITIWLKL